MYANYLRKLCDSHHEEQRKKFNKSEPKITINTTKNIHTDLDNKAKLTFANLENLAKKGYNYAIIDQYEETDPDKFDKINGNDVNATKTTCKI